jgi:hypothetical protein
VARPQHIELGVGTVQCVTPASNACLTILLAIGTGLEAALGPPREPDFSTPLDAAVAGGCNSSSSAAASVTAPAAAAHVGPVNAIAAAVVWRRVKASQPPVKPRPSAYAASTPPDIGNEWLSASRGDVPDSAADSRSGAGLEARSSAGGVGGGVGAVSVLVSGGGDAAVRVWRSSDLRPLRALRGHRGAVLALLVVQNLVVSGGRDNTIRCELLSMLASLQRLRSWSSIHFKNPSFASLSRVFKR